MTSQAQTEEAVSIPSQAARLIRRFQSEKHSGHIQLHFKDGRIMQTNHEVVEKVHSKV